MVIAIIIVIFGLIAIRTMPIEQYPDITPPMVEVAAVYQGADALTVEESVATPIEESINGVDGMVYMESTNANNGTMLLQVTFAVGTDPDLNTIFTQNRVSAATPKLPSSVITQGVTTTKTTTSFIQVLALYSDGRYDETFLSNYAIINLQDKLLRVNGVGKVQVMGAGSYAMRIWIDPAKLHHLGLSLEEIIGAINEQSQVVPGGSFGAQPTNQPTAFTYTIQMPAQYNTAEQFGNIVLRINPDGSSIRLGDVARLELGSQSYGVYATYQEQPATMLIINQSPGSNAVEVGKQVTQVMDEVAASFPEGMGYSVMVNATETIKLGIKEIIFTLLFALLLVILVIYLFLQNLRATLIPVIAIPVSLVGAFMLFPMLGFSINVFSLLGLVLAIGLVVDDAIVVVEAVQVQIAKGLAPKEATLAAMKSVASPIIACTSVLMAVFLPVALMPGAGGKLYQQFAITIAFSVAISGINALSLTPALSSILLRPQSTTPKEGWLNRFFARFNRGFNRSVDGYLNTNKVVMRHSGRSLIFIAIVAVAAFLIFRSTPSGFLPNEDQGYLIANVQLPAAASLERTKAVNLEVEQLLRKNENVESVVSAAGFSLISNSEAPNTGVMFIKLKPMNERKLKADAINAQLNEQLYGAINGAVVFTFGPPSIPGLGPSSGYTIMIEDRSGNTPQYLAEYTQKFIEGAMKRPEIASAQTLFQADVPQRAIDVDNEAILKAGISLSEVHNIISTYLGGTYVNNFNRFGRLYQTYIQADSSYRGDRTQLESYFVTNPQGESVPLTAFVTVRDTIGAQFTNRYNGYRAAAVSGLPAPKYSTSQSMAALEEVAAEVLPDDMG